MAIAIGIHENSLFSIAKIFSNTYPSKAHFGRICW